MIKAAFFDVDNTLYDWRSRRYIDSGIEAIKKAKENGVKVFVCSARPYASLKDFGVFDLGIKWNGSITTCGAFVTLGNRTVKSMLMDSKDIRKLCKTALSNSITMELVSPKRRYLIAPGNTYLENYYGTYVDPINDVHPYRGEGITGVLIFAPEEFDPLFKSIVPHFSFFRFHEYGLDISDGEHRKGEGIQAILDRLGVSKEEAISFGDDFQDITMGESSIFVCVGNGKEEVKKAADFVCPDIADDGLEFALREFEVIS
mgnify:CR=1 FL=1